MILAAFRAHLLSIPAVTTLVGQRVHADELPQNTSYPAIVLTLVSNSRQYDLAGSTGHAAPRVQCEVWAQSRAQAVDVAEVVKQALEEQRFTYQSLLVGPVRIDNELDLPSLAEAHPNLRVRTVDFTTWTSGA